MSRISKDNIKSSGNIAWEWYLDQPRSERIAVIVMIVFALLCIWKAATWNDAENVARDAAIEQARLAKPLTPAEIEQQAQEAEKNREIRRQERAAADINEVKGYETFLAEDEVYYKAQPASKADLEKIRKTLALFDGLAESLNKGRQIKAVTTKDDQAYLKGIENRLTKLQQRALPGLRLAFGKHADQILWEYNVDVVVSGNGNTTVNFISTMFAANSNIKATQQQIDEIITKLRFKQARYSWYKGSEYQYYTLKTPPDSQLAMFKFGEFQNLDK